MGNFISLILDLLKKNPTPTNTPFSINTPSPTISSEIQNVLSTLSEDERSKLLEQNIDTSVPIPENSITNELMDVYKNNIETFVGEHSYLKNTRTNKMSEEIFQRNTDSNILGPNTISK